MRWRVFVSSDNLPRVQLATAGARSNFCEIHFAALCGRWTRQPFETFSMGRGFNKKSLRKALAVFEQPTIWALYRFK